MEDMVKHQQRLMKKLKEKYKDLARSDEDVLSLALFEKVAVDFMTKRNNQDKAEEVEEFNLIIG